MNEDSKSRPEGRLGRWSRRKSGQEPEPEEKPQRSNKGSNEEAIKKQRGSAAPVAVRRVAPLLPPLAEPEEGEIQMEAAPPGAQALKIQLEAEQAAREEEEAEEDRELTPEEEDAVKDLPPIDSLNKDADFKPFFAENVPEFLKRQAYKVLWRSNPFFNLRDGLDDYDEDFSLAKLVGNVISEAKGASKSGQDRADDKTAKTVDADGTPDGEDDAVGDGEDEEITEAFDDTSDEAPREPRKSDVRPPEDAV